jgi:hypothetical protein
MPACRISQWQEAVPVASSLIAHLNLYKNANLSPLNPVARFFDKVRGKFPVATQQAHALCKAAEVTRREAQPSPGCRCGGTRIKPEAIEGDGVQFWEPLSGGGGHAPADENRVLLRSRSRYLPRSLRGERRLLLRWPQQIGQNAALQHLSLARFPRHAQANRSRFALPKLVLENAQSLVERGHQEVGNPVADRLLLRVGFGGCNQRCRAGNVARYQQRSACAIEFSGVEHHAAQVGFRVGSGTGNRGGNQARIKLLHPENEVECSRLFGIERKGKIFSAIQFEPPASVESIAPLVPAR